ncbi:nucleotidyltransferase family protein [Teredinibacter sp. KSP-S5-2]|uniref:nucleotidyltransferase domain-containing protein n=1 Tax=Teredinibacter sp. KSP-S5-2 TaxID=3034506 RepID=UPI0029343001|nr:nucleotidyltransferase family protein [Teredinibacter sp. KSP-S5-2]WNO09087.1 nucleotidyltransferase family protein [Teredinibacter sp. KSP-S5-2]
MFNEAPKISTELKLVALLSLPRLEKEQLNQVVALIQRVDVEKIKQLIDHHRTWPCVFKNCQRFNIPLFDIDYAKELAERFERHKQTCLKQFKALGEIKKLFREHGIPVKEFKGIPLARELYGDITLRQSRDLDVLISEDKRDIAHELLQDNGYKCPHYDYLSNKKQKDLLDFHKDRTYIAPNGITIEVHTRVCGYKTDFSNCASQRFLASFSDEEKIIIQLFYYCWHGSHTLFHRLKWVCDIALFITKHKTFIEGNIDSILAKSHRLDVSRDFINGYYLAAIIYRLEVPTRLKQQYQSSWLSKINSKLCLYYMENPAKQNTILFKLILFYFEVLTPRKSSNIFKVLTQRLKPTHIDLTTLPNCPSALYVFIRPFTLLYYYKLGKGR